MQTDEGGITCQDGEYAAGIFPLRGFFNNPLEQERLASEARKPASFLVLDVQAQRRPMA